MSGDGHASTTDNRALGAYIAIDRRPTGVALFNDHLRPGVPELMRRLHNNDVPATVLLTGDNLENALAVGQDAGVDDVRADLLPEDKVAVLQALKRQDQTVVMVGDGINDAPALATATVGVAMGDHGTGISAEAADIVLLIDDVTRLGDAIEIGQRTVRIAKQSIYVGLGASLVLMLIAAIGLLPPDRRTLPGSGRRCGDSQRITRAVVKVASRGWALALV